MQRIALLSTGRADTGGLASVARDLVGRSHVTWIKEGRDAIPEDFIEGAHLSIADIDLPHHDAVKRISSLTAQLGVKLAQDQPDLLLLLGDRYELLGALGGAVPLGVPVGHISGGEVTYGAFDEQVRHSVTKAAHLHFTAHETFATRVRQMGEEAWRVHVTGDPGLDGLHEKVRQPLPENFRGLIDRNSAIIALHPVTIDRDETWVIWNQIAQVLKDEPGFILVTGPNRDPDSDSLERLQKEWCNERPNRLFVSTLGEGSFATVVANAGCLLGNSSAAIWEAPSYGSPAVVIGTRQAGRLRGSNVIDVSAGDVAGLRWALRRARSTSFRQRCAEGDNPYGDGKAGRRIAEKLISMPPRATLLTKRFIDVEASDS